MSHKIFFPVLIMLGALGAIPFGVYAAVGITPSGASVTLAAGAQKDDTILFMRDPADAQTTMYISLASDDGFIVTEGIMYEMHPGDVQLRIPYRVDTRGYDAGTYTGILYVRPERYLPATTTSGVRVIVQGGVRIDVTIEPDDESDQTTLAHIGANMRDHLRIYADTTRMLAHRGYASAMRALGVRSAEE